MLIAEVTLHAKLVDGCGEVHSDLLLLRIVPNAHGDVSVAAETPDVVRHLEADDEDALVKLASTLAEGVGPVVPVEGSMFLGVKVGRVVLVLAFTFALNQTKLSTDHHRRRRQNAFQRQNLPF